MDTIMWYIYIPSLSIECEERSRLANDYLYQEPNSIINIILAILYNNSNPTRHYIKNKILEYYKTLYVDYRSPMFPSPIPAYSRGHSFPIPKIFALYEKTEIIKIYTHICNIIYYLPPPNEDRVVHSFEFYEKFKNNMFIKQLR